MEQEIKYVTLGRDPGKLLGTILPIAAITPHLYDVPMGEFFHTVAGALAAGTYTLQMTEFESGAAVVGFAAWGNFNQIVAARFRCKPDALANGNYTSGSISTLIAMASPLSPAFDESLRAHLRTAHPEMSVPEMSNDR